MPLVQQTIATSISNKNLKCYNTTSSTINYNHNQNQIVNVGLVQCSVCKDHKYTYSNCIIKCIHEHCKYAVHRYCYVDNIDAEQEWYIILYYKMN